MSEALTCALWAFPLATIITFIDIDNGFRTKRYGASLVLLHLPTVIFLILNGGLSAALVLWSTATPAGEGLNAIIPGSNIWTRSMFLVLATPAILKSKFFEFKSGDGEVSVGLEFFYDWARRKVLASLAVYGGIESSRQLDRLVAVVAARGIDERNKIRAFVLDVLEESKDQAAATRFKRQIAEIEKAIPAAELGGGTALSAMLDAAFDAIGIKPTRDFINRK